MDAHYHDVEGVSVYVPNVHYAKCPVCSPPAVVPAVVEAPAEVPVVPIRRPHRKAPHRPEAA